MLTIRRLLIFARKYWHWIGLTLVCMLTFTGLGLLAPQPLRLIIDRCLRGGDYHLLPYYALAIIVIAIVRGIFQFGQLYLMEFVAQKTVYDIRNRLFDHIQHLSFSYHDEAETGQLISRATADVDVLRRWLGHGLMHLLSDGLIFIGILVLCLSINWQLALVALSCIPFLIVAVFKYSGTSRPLVTAGQNQRGEMTAAIQQNLMGIRVVKSFAREDHEIGKFGKEAHELLERTLDTARVSAFYSPIMDFIAAISTAFILWYGGMQVVRGELSLGQWVVFNTYLAMLISPVRMMGWVVNQTQNAVASADRIFEILDTHPEVHVKDGNVEMRQCRGEVAFQNVSFSYGDGSRVLSNINLEVQP
ncbi:MAG: ABC transporter transmembrane domain-containing protein, partial [Armatimonadetes bacterium]|nr:ABC transporter transmembrane domain-containing protein [Armatimonadota bacterium]